MRRRLATWAAATPVPVEVTSDAAESLRLPGASFDAVVFTLVLCSVASPDRALAEARCVLRPTARLACWQDRFTPAWSRINAGCHPDRDIAAAIRRAGFTIETAESFDRYPRWMPARPLLEAVARPVPEWPPAIPGRAALAIRTMSPSSVVVTGGGPIVRLGRGTTDITMKEDRNDSVIEAQPDP
jgi:SAM-dependent methyltransferase